MINDDINITFDRKPTFAQSGAGTQLFGSLSVNKEDGDGTEENDYDPQYEAIVKVDKLDTVTTGEEHDVVLFKHRAKLYRFDKQWKERGVGDIKLTKNDKTGYCRVLMRRDQIYKVCANHAVMPNMELKPLMTSDTSWVWFTPSDYSEGLPPQPIQFCVKFKNKEIAEEFSKQFVVCQNLMKDKIAADELKDKTDGNKEEQTSSQPPEKPSEKPEATENESSSSKPSPFASINFSVPSGGNGASPFASLFGGNIQQQSVIPSTQQDDKDSKVTPSSPSYQEDDIYVDAIVQVSKLDTVSTGEEDEDILFENRCKLYRFDSDKKQWKERGVGQIKLAQRKNQNNCRLIMRRDQVHKLCANHAIIGSMEVKRMNNSDKSWTWFTQSDFSEGETKPEYFCAKFKNEDIALEFKKTFEKCKCIVDGKEADADKLGSEATIEETGQEEKPGFSFTFEKSGDFFNTHGFVFTPPDSKEQPKETIKDSLKEEAKKSKSIFAKFAPKEGSWNCDTCLILNTKEVSKCVACETPNPNAPKGESKEVKSRFSFRTTQVSGFSYGGTNSRAPQPSGFSFGSANSETRKSAVFLFAKDEAANSKKYFFKDCSKERF